MFVFVLRVCMCLCLKSRLLALCDDTPLSAFGKEYVSYSSPRLAIPSLPAPKMAVYECSYATGIIDFPRGPDGDIHVVVHPEVCMV